MQVSEWQIIDYFKQFIFGFIYSDIERCIEARANYIVALALLSYTEYIGALISGNLGLKNKGKKSFKKALEYFPKEYRDIDSSLEVEYTDEKGDPKKDSGIYSLFRCGMVHEFFIKGFATVYNDPLGCTKDHIGVIKAEHLIEWPEELSIAPYKNKVLEFYTNEYFRDFRSATEQIFKRLIVDKDPQLMEGFRKSLYRVYKRRIKQLEVGVGEV